MTTVFSSWSEANQAGYQARGLWRDMGFVINKGEKARAEVDNEEVTECKVYHLDQVRKLKEPQRSKRILIGSFLGRCEWFAIRDHKTGKISQHHSTELRGSLKDLVYRTFLYRNRTTGIRVPILWQEHKRAEGLDFRATQKTRYIVLDLDNHHPTRASTKAHLLLVRRLVDLLPRLVKFIGGGRVFFDYRQDAPQGLHIWIWFKYPRITKSLHQQVRTFLINNVDPELDGTLLANGLKEMGAVELLPSETHCMRFFGGYDRRVFTTEELKPTKHGFDAESFLKHLNGAKRIGDPCQRYGELTRAGIGLERHSSEAPATISPRTLALTSDSPTQKGNFFIYLVDACLNGVSEPDELYGTYLVPISTALYFREFYGDPKRNEKVVSTLMDWLDLKHNGQVSRIKDDQKEELERCVRGIVRKMVNTPEKIRGFWSSVRQRDIAHPDHRLSLMECMRAVLDKPLVVTRENLPEVRRLLDGDEATSSPASTVEVFLPGTVEARLRHHLLVAGRAPGVRTERIVRFADRLIKAFGLSGHSRIHWTRINKLAGLGKGRKSAGEYKTLLCGADILEPGWDRTKRVGKRNAEYRLLPWVVDEIRKACLPAETPESPRKDIQGVIHDHVRYRDSSHPARSGAVTPLVDSTTLKKVPNSSPTESLMKPP